MTGPGPHTVFICAFGHSGSTLLEMLLAGHPSMVAVGELQNLSGQIAIGRPCSCGKLPKECHRWRAVARAIEEKTGVPLFERPFDFRVSRERPRSLGEKIIRLWNRSLYYAHFSGGPLSRVRLDRLVFDGDRMMANTDLVATTVRALAQSPILIDSSKDYVRMRERYAAAARGQVKVIYLYRDGRGAVWSVMKSWRASIWHCSKEWAKCQRRIRRMLRGVAREDRLEMRYEDLCEDTETTLRLVCSWLHVEYSDAMLELQPEEHHTVAGNKIRLERGMIIRPDESWRENLTPFHLRVFQLLAGRENDCLGYSRS